MSRSMLVAAVALLLGLAWWALERGGRRRGTPEDPAEEPSRLSSRDARPPPPREEPSDRRRVAAPEPADQPDGWTEALVRAYDSERTAPPAPASVRGFVWRADGTPVIGAQITLSDREWGWTQHVSGPLRTKLAEPRRATTAADGRYSFDEVEPATHTVVLEPGLDIGASYSKAVVRLGAGEQRRLDFGVPFEWPRLRGSLRTRSGGAPHQGASVHAHGTGTPSASARSEVGPDGAFELRLPPGRYALAAQLAPGEDHRAPLGELELGADDERVELRLQGTRLTGSVTRIDRGTPLTGTDRYQELWLRSTDDDALFRRTWVDRDGRFAFDALEPGTYVLDGFPLSVASGVGSLRVDVLAGKPTLEIEVGVAAP